MCVAGVCEWGGDILTKLPNIDQAVVEDSKLAGYLLSSAHPQGGAKARFLIGFGFSDTRLNEAREAFLEHAHRNEISGLQQTSFGTLYEIDGPLPSPDGRNPVVRTVWMQDIGAAAPRLVTMRPRRGRSARRGL